MARAFGFDGLGICVLLMGDRNRNEGNKIGWAFVFDGLGFYFDGMGLCCWAEDRGQNGGRSKPVWKKTDARMREDRGQDEWGRGQNERRSKLG